MTMLHKRGVVFRVAPIPGVSVGANFSQLSILSLPFHKGLGVSLVNAFTKALSASGSFALSIDFPILTPASLQMKCHTDRNGESGGKGCPRSYPTILGLELLIYYLKSARIGIGGRHL